MDSLREEDELSDRELFLYKVHYIGRNSCNALWIIPTAAVS